MGTWSPFKEETLQTLLKERNEEREARMLAFETYVHETIGGDLLRAEEDQLVGLIMKYPAAFREATRLAEAFLEVIP